MDVLIDKVRHINVGQGYVQLLDCLPRVFDQPTIDAYVPRIARISTNSQGKDDKSLLRYLMRCHHDSPFEFIQFNFKIKCPMFVRNQIFRHRTMSVNESSARYGVIIDEVFHPSEHEDGIRFSGTSNRQSSLLNPELRQLVLPEVVRVEEAVDGLLTLKNSLLKNGVASEVARFCLPVATMTEFVISVNLRNLLHFLDLRLRPDAQLETRNVANALLTLIKQLVPETIACWEDFVFSAVTFSSTEMKLLSSGEVQEKLSKTELISFNEKKRKLGK